VANEDVIRIVRTGSDADYAVSELDADVARSSDVRACLASSGQADTE